MDEEFIRLIKSGELNKIQTYLQNNPTFDISASNEKAFGLACWFGHLEVAYWLYQFTPNINIHAGNEYAFCTACENGHLEVAQWLYRIAMETGRPIITMAVTKIIIFVPKKKKNGKT
jgi:hypothetical protein